jgi:hypothetical protein
MMNLTLFLVSYTTQQECRLPNTSLAIWQQPFHGPVGFSVGRGATHLGTQAYPEHQPIGQK